MKLQYCENGINPRTIIGVDNMLLKSKIVQVTHSKECVTSKVKVEDQSIIYLETDSMSLSVKLCTNSGEITSIENYKSILLQFSDDNIILDGDELENIFSIYICDD